MPPEFASQSKHAIPAFTLSRYRSIPGGSLQVLMIIALAQIALVFEKKDYT